MKERSLIRKSKIETGLCEIANDEVLVKNGLSCWRQELMELDQPFLKETPRAWNELLKPRHHSFLSLRWQAFRIQGNSVKIRFCQNGGNKSPVNSFSLFLDVNSTYSSGAVIFNGIPKGWASSSDRRQLCYESVHKLCASN